MKTRLLAAFLLVLAVAACGPLPRPFGRDVGEVPKPLARNISLDTIEVEPLSGTTRPMGELLARAVASSLEREYEIPAALSGLDKSRYILTGHVHMQQIPGSDEADISIGWQLDVRGGEVLANYVQDVEATQLEWDYGAPDIPGKVGQQTGEWVARSILGERFDDAGTDRLLGKRGVYVTDVTGAPGDGNSALRRSMIVALGGQGLKIAEGVELAAFTVSSEVSVGIPEDGAQPVRIVWSVRDVTGAIVGRAEQANAVPVGSLDGRWGQTAAFVAAAAVDGIIDIIARNDPSKLRAPNLGAPSSRSASPPPPTRSLPRTPGRAPPPPG